MDVNGVEPIVSNLDDTLTTPVKIILVNPFMHPAPRIPIQSRAKRSKVQAM